MEQKFIPVCEPLIGKKDIDNVIECLNTGWISSSGKFIDEFEKSWSEYCGMKYGVAVSNGSTALHIALACLDIKEGDEVIMPTFTIISCANAIILNNAKPVLIDSDPITFTIDTSKIEEKITEKTRAIMVVHIYGHPCDMDPILKIAEKYNLYIIEDAAEAHGARYKNRIAGSFGDISCFSFYANKIVTTGEGGMVLTNNSCFAEKAKSFRNLCFKKEKRFYHEEIGFNFRITNMQAAIGVAQVERIEENISKKRWIAKKYNEFLSDLSNIILPAEMEWAKNVYWMYGVVLKDKNLNNEEVSKALLEYGIETRPFFLGMHQQPVFKKMGLFIDENYPIAENLAEKGFYLPSGLSLTEKEIKYISSSLKKVLKHY